jgi:hypothetical protein
MHSASRPLILTIDARKVFFNHPSRTKSPHRTTPFALRVEVLNSITFKLEVSSSSAARESAAGKSTLVPSAANT